MNKIDEPILQVKHVYKKFSNTKDILKDFTFDVKKGERIAIIGPSGSGKSTLLRCITQLSPIDGGEVYFQGKLISPVDKTLHEENFDARLFAKENSMPIKYARSKIGLVFQGFNLFKNLTVLENLILAPIQLRLMSKEHAVEKARNYLYRIGLLDKQNTYPANLSGGQMQRIAIIRSLMIRPEMLLLDEITSALDPQMTKEVLNLMEDLANRGMTMIIVTHQLDFARKIASKVLFIQDAKIQESGDAEELFSNPKTKELKDFLASM